MLETLFRGIAVGGLLAVGIGMMRDRPRTASGFTGALFCLATCGFVLHTGTGIPDQLGPLRYLAWLLSAGGTAYFWLFGVSLFSDARLRPWHAAPILVMTMIIVAGRLLPGNASVGTEVAHNILELALVGHAMLVIWTHRDEDLADTRRRIRIPVMFAVACFCAVLSGFDIAWSLGYRDPWIKLSQSVALAIIALTGGWAFVRIRRELFLGSRVQPHVPETRTTEVERVELTPSELAVIEKLSGAGDQDPIWRRPGLTVGAAADVVGLPEYRLRQLINQTLGYRNFSEFLNAKRIAVAMEELRDPAKASVRISTVAFDLGYASLGPFNRAFKDATGMSPREWREAGRTGSESTSDDGEAKV